MRPSFAIAILVVAAVIVVGLLIDSPWSSDNGDHSKATVVANLSKIMEEHHVPPKLSKCFVSLMEKEVSEAEVRRAYAKEAPMMRESQSPIAEFPPPLSEKVSRIGLLCLGRMIRSGDYSRQEIGSLMQGMRP